MIIVKEKNLLGLRRHSQTASLTETNSNNGFAGNVTGNGTDSKNGNFTLHFPNYTLSVYGVN